MYVFIWVFLNQVSRSAIHFVTNISLRPKCDVCFLSVRGSECLSLQCICRNQPRVLEIPLRNSPLPSKGLEGLLSTFFYPNEAKIVQ